LLCTWVNYLHHNVDPNIGWCHLVTNNVRYSQCRHLPDTSVISIEKLILMGFGQRDVKQTLIVFICKIFHCWHVNYTNICRTCVPVSLFEVINIDKQLVFMSDNRRVMYNRFGNGSVRQFWPLNCGCVLTRYKFDQAYARKVFQFNVPYVEFYCCNRHAIVVFLQLKVIKRVL